MSDLEIIDVLEKERDDANNMLDVTECNLRNVHVAIGTYCVARNI